MYFSQNTDLFSEDFVNKKYDEYISKLNLDIKDNDLNIIRDLDLVNYLYEIFLRNRYCINVKWFRNKTFLDNRIVNYAMNINLNKNVTLFSGKINLRKILNSHLSKISKNQTRIFSSVSGQMKLVFHLLTNIKMISNLFQISIKL